MARLQWTRRDHSWVFFGTLDCWGAPAAYTVACVCWMAEPGGSGASMQVNLFAHTADWAHCLSVRCCFIIAIVNHLIDSPAAKASVAILRPSAWTAFNAAAALCTGCGYESQLFINVIVYAGCGNDKTCSATHCCRHALSAVACCAVELALRRRAPQYNCLPGSRHICLPKAVLQSSYIPPHLQGAPLPATPSAQ